MVGASLLFALMGRAAVPGIAISFGFGVRLFDDTITAMALTGMVLIVAAGVTTTLLRGSKVPGADAAPTET